MFAQSKFKFLVFSLAFLVIGVLISNSAFSQGTPDTHGIQQKKYKAHAGERKGKSPGNIHIGPLILNPKLGERVEYDDNVYQVSGLGTKLDGQRERKKSDMINIVSPGLKVTLPIKGGSFLTGKGHSIDLDWISDFKSYRDHADQNQDNYYILGTGIFSFPKGFDLLFQDSYSHTKSASGGETDNIHPVRTNIFSATASLPDYFKDIDVDFTYSNFNQDYLEKALGRANRNESRFTLKIPYHISPKITVFPEYAYGFTHYNSQSRFPESQRQSNSHMNAMHAGVEWAVTAKTTGIFKMGFTYIDYNDTRTHDVKTPTIHLGMDYSITRRTQLNLLAGRQPNVSEFTAGSTVYINNFGRISISRKLWRDWSAVAHFRYDKNQYYGSSRKEDIYVLGVSSQYNITKWLNFNARYSYRDRHSNFELQADRINRASIGINIAF